MDLLFSGAYGRVVALLWGTIWGSFFNVVIARVPLGQSVVRPGSHCFTCGAPIAWYDNIPFVSYLLLRGRCRRCGASFSPRYLLVEVMVALLSLGAHQLFVVGQGGPLGVRLARFVIVSMFAGVLVALSVIDLKTLRLPDAITYPAIPVFAALSLLMGHPHLWDGPVGAVAGYLTIRLIADGYLLLTGRLGMGYGDAKLLAIIGGLLGWQALLPTLFLASFQGSIIGIAGVLILGHGAHDPEDEEDEGDEGGEEDEEAQKPQGASLRHARVPFGPFLALGALEVVVLQGWIAQILPFLW